MPKKYQAPIVAKAFDILKLISKSDKGLGISDIAASLNIGKSTVHGIAAALEAQGAIAREPDSKKYVLGLTLMELGKSVFERADIQKIARPFMVELMEQCRESVFLGIRNHDRVVVVDIVESSKDFKITSPIGTALPLFAGALGKIFLSAVPPETARQYLEANPLPLFTSTSIRDVDPYLEELQKVKQQGYAFDDEEYIPGVRAVAVPLAQCGPHEPAVWVVGFKAGMKNSRISQIIEQACRAAEQINRLLLKT